MWKFVAGCALACLWTGSVHAAVIRFTADHVDMTASASGCASLVVISTGSVYGQLPCTSAYGSQSGPALSPGGLESDAFPGGGATWQAGASVRPTGPAGLEFAVFASTGPATPLTQDCGGEVCRIEPDAQSMATIRWSAAFDVTGSDAIVHVLPTGEGASLTTFSLTDLTTGASLLDGVPYETLLDGHRYSVSYEVDRTGTACTRTCSAGGEFFFENAVIVVPEPGTLGLLGIALLGALVRRRGRAH
jgi:hypothetical protein